MPSPQDGNPPPDSPPPGSPPPGSPAPDNPLPDNRSDPQSPVHPGVSRAATGWLLAVLAPAVLLAAVTTVALVPLTRDAAATGPTAAGEQVTARVVAVSATACTPEELDRTPVTQGSSVGTCVTARLTVAATDRPADSPADVEVEVPLDVYRAGLEPGDRVLVAPPTGDLGWTWVDVDRSIPLTALAAGFALAVVLVGRRRGAAALAGLAVAYLAILEVLLPALLGGARPLPAALSVSVVAMTVLLYTTHGPNAKTSVALVGTLAGLGATAALSGWVVDLLFLAGPASEEDLALAGLTGRTDLSGLVVAGTLVAGLGVLNDVTVTQASAVWEVQANAPHLGRRDLFRSGIRVGRDHLGSTVYTIAFAYAGAALPTLLLARLSGASFGRVLTSAEVAQEVARTCVGGIGLVLAVPVTTAVAAAVAATRGQPVGTPSASKP